mmetsp:Transcript_54800/g.134022  ORF Transcript_54800/g.134022 Transcript_54800/m.134022 type:complete len:239 (+) Transcript_54800:140-856(+)
MIGWVRNSRGWGTGTVVQMEAVQREEARKGESSVSGEPDANSTTSVALPQHWTEHISKTSGLPFFENIETGLKQWSVPTETHMSFGIEASSAPVHVQSDPFGLRAIDSVTAKDMEVAMGTDEQADKAKKKLMSTGVLTVVAIAIHNFRKLRALRPSSPPWQTPLWAQPSPSPSPFTTSPRACAWRCRCITRWAPSCVPFSGLPFLASLSPLAPCSGGLCSLETSRTWPTVPCLGWLLA